MDGQREFPVILNHGRRSPIQWHAFHTALKEPRSNPSPRCMNQWLWAAHTVCPGSDLI
jgi:hypothetical protein